MTTWKESEVQGCGRRYWFAQPETAREFAKTRAAKGYPVLIDETDWNDPDCGPSVWVSRSKQVTAEVQGYKKGIDTASGYFAGRAQ